MGFGTKILNFNYKLEQVVPANYTITIKSRKVSTFI